MNSIDDLLRIKESFQTYSGLKFTYELGTNQKINFLDVHVDGSGGQYVTSVYTKPTNTGVYLNADSECPQRNKDGTIKALTHRRYKTSSNWHLFHDSMQILKQSLINNGYSNPLFDSILSNYTNKLNFKRENSNQTVLLNKIYYKNQYSEAYKTDERILRQIVKNNTTCTKQNERIQLVIYYERNTVSNLITHSETPLVASTE